MKSLHNRGQASGQSTEHPQHENGARSQGLQAPTSRRDWLVQALPTTLVLAAMGAVAIWGHHSGWSVPTFAALVRKDAAAADDWCPAHAVPESICVECNPALLPKGKEYGWCKVHGVHECPLEHPDVAQLQTSPQVTPEDLARAQRALATLDRPENNSKCKLHLRRVQFASVEAFQRAGIEVEPVWRGPMTECLLANGEITYDQTRVARVSSRLGGAVWRLDKKVGDAVQKGEVVALVESAEVGRAKTEFLQAFTELRFKTETYQSLQTASASVTGQRLRDAALAVSAGQIRLLSARQALVNLGLPIELAALKDFSEAQLVAAMQFLGLPDSVRQSLDGNTTTANLLPVKSPLTGVIVGREAVAGEVVDTAKVLLVVADISGMWLTLNVRQEDARRVRAGQEIRLRPHGETEEVSARINWISTAIDEKTRTIMSRADLPNAGGRLRDHAFGMGRIVLREEKETIIVPHEAVHSDGDCSVVFVRDKNFLGESSPKVFHTRSVRTGARDDRHIEIIAGVLPGEIVATKGSGTLRAELLKSGLGEG